MRDERVYIMRKQKMYLLVFIFSCLFIYAGCNKKTNEATKEASAIIIENTIDTDSLQQETTIIDQPEQVIEEIEEPIESIISDAYVQILDKAYDIITTNETDFLAEDGWTGLVESIQGRPTEECVVKIGYTLIDIDNNGTEELVISDDGEEAWANRILSIYTMHNDEAVQIVDGWARNRYYLLEDNTLYNEGSGGAAYTIWGTYKVSEDGLSLQAMDTYFTDFQDENMQEIGWFHNTTGSVDIAESEWVGTDEENSLFPLMEQMQERVRDLDLIYFADYPSERAKYQY